MAARAQAVALAARFIAQEESFSPTPYLCPAGKWTIGFGSRVLLDGRPVTASSRSLTRAEAERLLQFRLAQDAGPLEKACGALTPALSDCEEAALLSFSYNVGLANALGSTLVRKLAAGDRQGAAAQFLVWNKMHDRLGRLVISKGLTARRKREAELFLEQGAP